MCNITQGIEPTGCEQSLPGIQPSKIWVANYGDIASFTAGSDDSNYEDITLEGGKYLWKFDIHKNSGSFTEELQTSDNSGDYYTQTVTFRVIDDSLSTLLAAREQLGTELVFIMKKRNGRFYVLGDLEGLKLGEGTMHDTGSAPGDDNGRVFVYTGIVENQAKQLITTGGTYDETAIEALLDALLETS